MTGERLRLYDLDLCDYVVGQFRMHLRELRGRPSDVSPLSRPDWHRLDLPTWLGRAVAALPAALADHVWAGVAGDKVMRSLTDAELAALRRAADDPPIRWECECVWAPHPALHREAVACIPEIKAALTRQTAEEWAEQSAVFAAQLCGEDLPLADGIRVVHDWLYVARRLRDAITATDAVLEAGTADGTNRKVTRRSKAVDRIDTDSLRIPEMLSAAVVARRYGVSRSTIYTACLEGTLPHYRVPAKPGARGKYLVREADVAAWIESFRVSSNGCATPAASAPAPSGSMGGLFSELDPKKLARAWQSR